MNTSGEKETYWPLYLIIAALCVPAFGLVVYVIFLGFSRLGELSPSEIQASINTAFDAIWKWAKLLLLFGIASGISHAQFEGTLKDRSDKIFFLLYCIFGFSAWAFICALVDLDIRLTVFISGFVALGVGTLWPFLKSYWIEKAKNYDPNDRSGGTESWRQ